MLEGILWHLYVANQADVPLSFIFPGKVLRQKDAAGRTQNELRKSQGLPIASFSAKKQHPWALEKQGEDAQMSKKRSSALSKPVETFPAMQREYVNRLKSLFTVL